MAKSWLFYARFMGDWVVITTSRWKLRSVVRIVNRTLNMLRVDKQPDKTYIGKIEMGFSFPGYFLEPGNIRVAVDTIKRFALRITRLYEQGADVVRIGEYVRHWWVWVRAGLCNHTFLIIKILSRGARTVLEQSWRLLQRKVCCLTQILIINAIYKPLIDEY